VYSKLVGDNFIYMILYIYDMTFIGNNKEIIKDVKTQPYFEYDMKYFGAKFFILGMEIKRDWVNNKL
jgi:hypothetical protein